MSRYYVDERAGCLAVRDREKTDPDYPGLSAYMEGVVRFWPGIPITNDCPTCGHSHSEGWWVRHSDKQEALVLCAELNRAADQAIIKNYIILIEELISDYKQLLLKYEHFGEDEERKRQIKKELEECVNNKPHMKEKTKIKKSNFN